MRLFGLLLLLLVSTPATASNDATEAEHARLSEEIEALVKRKVWTGVERKYQELEALGTELTLDDLLNGAHAARALGDVQSTYDRLKAAARIKGTKEIVNWLWDIDNNYGHVELVSTPARSMDLVPDEMPFDPNQRICVEAAIEHAKDDGVFIGLLPKGGYSFQDQKFLVEPGVSVKIEISPKARRQGIIEPVIRYPEETNGEAGP